MDEHDTRIEELIALVADHVVSRSAFAEAVKRRPGKLITLRQKSRVLAELKVTCTRMSGLGRLADLACAALYFR